MRVYKYEVPMIPVFNISLPTKHKILHFGSQNENLYIWMLVDTSSYEEVTGAECQEDYLKTYIGTAFLHDDSSICHLFTY